MTTINWTRVSREAHGRMQAQTRGFVLLERPLLLDTEITSHPEVLAWRKSSTSLSVGGHPSAKDLRRYMWDHRNDRTIRRGRGFLWWDHPLDDETIMVGLGTITHIDALAHLKKETP